MSIKSLTIHFDLNGTIMFGDLASGRDLEQSVNYFISKEIHHNWIEGKPPLSYFDFVHNHLYPGPPSEQKMNRDLLFNRFVPWLIETKHPLSEEVKPLYERLITNLKESIFFPSFFKALDLINKKGHTIIFRTFGTDLEHVEKLIQTKYPSMSPQKARFIEIEGEEELTLELLGEDKKASASLKDPKAILDLFDSHPYWLVQDCYPFWHKKGHDEKGLYGKPFPYRSDSSRNYLFFDDNAEKNPQTERTIVNPIEITGSESKPVNIPDTEGRVIKARFLEAALNPDYFCSQFE
jgi:hypothetical protein